jgi:mono/diheme cytochrome c family protein
MQYVAALTLLVAGTQAGSQTGAGDPAVGRALAERWCAECHQVEPGNRHGKPGGPPAFQTVADDPAVTEISLRAFFQSQHATMPQVMPNPEQTADLIAYILKLRGLERSP